MSRRRGKCTIQKYSDFREFLRELEHQGMVYRRVGNTFGNVPGVGD